MQDQRVSVGRRKARLSEYLRRASAGLPVLITSRGRPIARLVPLTGSDARTGYMARLVHAGLVRAPWARLDVEVLAEFGLADPGSSQRGARPGGEGGGLLRLLEQEPSDEARRLLRIHAVRAADALQLAAASVRAGPVTGAEFVTLDERLALAARLEGFRILP